MERIVIKETTIEKLSSYLMSHGIPIEQWGKGESKTLAHLLAEVNSGESTLQESENWKLLRVEESVGIGVFYKDGDTTLKLKEDRQEFSDGRVRRRDLSTSVGEKMKPGELPRDAAKRTLNEELKISGVSLSNNFTFEERRIIPSTSYPGLNTKNTLYIFSCVLTAEEYNPDGYIEVQEDKTNYFVWEPIN